MAAPIIVDGEPVEMTEGLREALTVEATEPVPAFVTNFQARTALRRAGLYDAAHAAVQAKAASLDPVEGAILLDAWNNASFGRNSQNVLDIAAALGLSEAQMDALFQEAGRIAF